MTAIIGLFLSTVGLDVGCAPAATAYPMFCANHEEYRTPPHVMGDVYKTACAIPRRLCQGALVQAARPRPIRLVRDGVHGTAWMTPCDYEQGRGSTDLAEAVHRWRPRAHH
jgi:hypothetical protein